MSNMSSARAVDINWTGVSGGKTISRYDILIGILFPGTNIVTVSGRLADGSTLLNVVLNREKMRVLSAEIQRILNNERIPTMHVRKFV